MKTVNKFENVYRKRVQLARDIIGQINADLLRALNGDIFSYSTITVLRGSTFRSPDLSSVNCGVCAKGAVVIAFMRRHNKITGGEACDFSPVEVINHKRINAIFPVRMIAEMETLFERKMLDWNFDLFNVAERKALRSAQKEFPDDANSRLIAIMERLIKNRGRKIVLKPAKIV
jgi:hypothetical protein